MDTPKIKAEQIKFIVNIQLQHRKLKSTFVEQFPFYELVLFTQNHHPNCSSVISNKCIRDDTKATTRQSPYCIFKKHKN